MPDQVYRTYASELGAVADAIRAKGGTVADLEFPADFITAIQNIPTGGTDTWGVNETPLDSLSDAHNAVFEFGITIGALGAYVLYLESTISNPSVGDIVAIVHDSDGTRVWAYDGTNALEDDNVTVTATFNDAGQNVGQIVLTVAGNTYQFNANADYGFMIVHGGSGSITFRTASATPASGQTSATFSVEEEPALYFAGLLTSVQANQYHRVQTVIKWDEIFSGTNFYTNTLGYYTDFTETFNNGSLTIASSGTNNGGYFHNPGTYTLYYLLAEDLTDANLQKKTVTPTASGFTVKPDAGYDALSQVTVEGDQNLVAGNVRNGVQIFDVLGTYDAGGGASIDTKTLTNNDNTATSLQFTNMKGQPLIFILRLTSQVSSSGSTTYYYVVVMRYNGSNTAGNVFRIGSTRRIDNVTSGYSFSYSGTTLTVSSSGNRTTSPGSFYSGTYELIYCY